MAQLPWRSTFGLDLPGGCAWVHFPTVADPRGDLTFIHQRADVFHNIRRVYYIYNVPTTESRGGHAHRRLQRTLICVSGSLDVLVDVGQGPVTVHLSEPTRGLYLPPMVWSVQTNFSPGTVCLVLASLPYDESDYIRDYETYTMELKRCRPVG